VKKTPSASLIPEETTLFRVSAAPIKPVQGKIWGSGKTWYPYHDNDNILTWKNAVVKTQFVSRAIRARRPIGLCPTRRRAGGVAFLGRAHKKPAGIPPARVAQVDSLGPSNG